MRLGAGVVSSPLGDNQEKATLLRRLRALLSRKSNAFAKITNVVL